MSLALKVLSFKAHLKYRIKKISAYILTFFLKNIRFASDFSHVTVVTIGRKKFLVTIARKH